MVPAGRRPVKTDTSVTRSSQGSVKQRYQWSVGLLFLTASPCLSTSRKEQVCKAVSILLAQAGTHQEETLFFSWVPVEGNYNACRDAHRDLCLPPPTLLIRESLFPHVHGPSPHTECSSLSSQVHNGSFLSTDSPFSSCLSHPVFFLFFLSSLCPICPSPPLLPL